ncbi:MYG1 family protein [Sulfitobacter alexandrii]|nr:MYG1 family protein [Sulfitobacter alexandrii]
MMPDRGDIRNLVTHSGGFHADELLSSVVLTRLYPDARLIRSRDAEWITPSADRIVYDVGRQYAPDAQIFDHHQLPGPMRPDGRPYSSIGLIWAHYGRAYLRALDVPESAVEQVHAAVDSDFVLPVDLMDNGALDPGSAGFLSELTLPVLLETLKPEFDDRSPAADDAAFAAALPVARTFLEAAVKGRAAKQRAAAMVHAAIVGAGRSQVLELPMGMPFRDAIAEAGADHLLFVVHPRDTDWAITGIRKDADSFALRADLPAHWAGLTGPELAQASGVPGARFCHAARFLAVAADRDSALRMAALAVEAAQ